MSGKNLKRLKDLNGAALAGLALGALALGGCANANGRGARGTENKGSPISLAADGDHPFGGRGAARNAGSPRWDAPFGFYGELMAAESESASAEWAHAGEDSLTKTTFSVEGADFDPSVTPDGGRIVFASTQHSASSDIYIKGVESRVVTQLTTDPSQDVMPKVSPDGARIAFSSNRSGNWDLFVMPLAGGRAMQLTTEPAHDLHPSWSPDGRFLTFCRLGEMSGKWEIWITDVQNSGVAQFLTYGLFPEWCPVAGTGQDGADRILFQRSRERGDRSFSVWTIDYKGGQAGNATEVVSSAVAACINPSWSPDAEWITFTTVPNATEWAATAQARPASANLWMVSSAGGGLVSLTSGDAVNLMPTWGPGNQLFFISDRGGVDNIWTINTTGAILAATGGRIDAPAIGHGGEGPTVPAHGEKTAVVIDQAGH